MAIHSQGINLILFHELKKCYPEVPDGILTDHMKQYRNDRSRCIEALATESPKYLFGSSVHQATNQLHRSIQDMTIEQSDMRRRSDSASSSCSASSSGMPNSVQRPSSNPNLTQTVTPIYSAKIDTVNIEPQQLDKYVLSKNYPNQIPQIQCHTYKPSEAYSRNTGQEQNLQNSPPSQMRQIQVYRLTGSSQQDPSAVQNQFSIYPKHTSYKVELGPQMTQQGSFTSPQQSDYFRHPIVCIPPPPLGQGSRGQYITESPTFFPNNRSPVSTQVPSYGQPSPQFIGQHSQGNHSSQATIVLNKIASLGRVSPEQTVPVMPSHGQPQLLVPSYCDSQLDRVQVQYKINDVVLPEHNTLPLVNDEYNTTSVNLARSPIPSSAYFGQLYPADALSTGTLLSGTSQGSSSQVTQMYRHYPPMQDQCMVPGHQQGVVRSSSRENEPTNVALNPNVERLLQNPVKVMSPASSHSSLSSESSQLENQRRRRSVSLQEEQAYVQALNHHQKQRMEKLRQDLEAHLQELIKIQLEVSHMQNNKLEQQQSRSSSFPSIADAEKLREHNLRLETDIQVMTREIDMFNNGQTPLGILDPLEEQNFYKHMNTGQQGSIYPKPAVTSPLRDVPPPVHPRLQHVPPPPPPQPPTGSGDSEGDGEQWSCSACTLINHPALKQCECCEMPRTISIAATCGDISSSIGSNLNYAGS